MGSPSRLFDEQLMQNQLNTLLPSGNVQLEYLSVCDSTNRVCMQGLTDASIVLSDQQTAGRGRRGKVWVSEKNKNLYCSIGLSKTLSAVNLGLISILVGVSIADVISEQGYPDLTLKWPNDVLLQGKKLGGILIETRALADDEFFLVIGIGLNLHMNQKQLEQIDQPAIGLNHLPEINCDSQFLVTQLIARVIQSVMDFDVVQSSDLLHRFKQYDFLRDKQVVVKTANENVYGHYAGLKENGQVNISLPDGMRSFAAAEISLRES